MGRRLDRWQSVIRACAPKPSAIATSSLRVVEGVVVPVFQMWNLVRYGRVPKPRLVLSKKLPRSRLNFAILCLWESRVLEFSRVITMTFSQILREADTLSSAQVCVRAKSQWNASLESCLRIENRRAKWDGIFFLKWEQRKAGACYTSRRRSLSLQTPETHLFFA